MNSTSYRISDSCLPGVSQWCSTAGDSSPLAAITLNLSDYGASHRAGTQPGHHSTVQYSTVQCSTIQPGHHTTIQPALDTRHSTRLIERWENHHPSFFIWSFTILGSNKSGWLDVIELILICKDTHQAEYWPLWSRSVEGEQQCSMCVVMSRAWNKGPSEGL